MNIEKISSYKSMVKLWANKLNKCSKTQANWIKLQIKELETKINEETSSII